MLVSSWPHIHRRHVASGTRRILMISMRWCCALHEVGLAKRLAVHAGGTRVASFAATAHTCVAVSGLCVLFQQLITRRAAGETFA